LRLRQTRWSLFAAEQGAGIGACGDARDVSVTKESLTGVSEVKEYLAEEHVDCAAGAVPALEQAFE